MTKIHVATAAPYDVVLGSGVLDDLVDVLGPAPVRVGLIFDRALIRYVGPLLDHLRGHYDVVTISVPSGERAKTAEIAEECWYWLGEQGFTRSDAIVTLGGGATTDLGGFVAATWLRGVRVVHVPTSVLAMVDAAVGGKTGINTDAGKNLVGAFHEPAGVVCDLDFLTTLPRAEVTAGLGEVIKCGFIADTRILDLVEESDPATIVPGSDIVTELIARAIAVKAGVVAEDLTETGGTDEHPGREILNYGHTLAHALEKFSKYRVRHGEAVALGCVYAAEIAARSGLLDTAVVDRHRQVFARVGLPVSLREVRLAKAPFEVMLDSIRVDKKTRGNVLRFLVLTGVGQPRILRDPAESVLRDAYEALR